MAQATLINVLSDREPPYGPRHSDQDQVQTLDSLSAVKRKAEGFGHSSFMSEITARHNADFNDAFHLSKKLKTEDIDGVDGSFTSLPTHEIHVEDAGGQAAWTPSQPDEALKTEHNGDVDHKIESSGFRFEGLPPEVRMMIYKCLFVKEDDIRPLSHEDRYMEEPGSAQPPNLSSALSFLRTSRRINAEASAVLYGQNRFLIYGDDYGEVMLLFLQTIGKQNRHAIRNVELDWQHGIRKAHKSNKANELFAMAGDGTNPMSKDIAKMLHSIARATVLKFVDSLEEFVGSPSLEHLTLICPGTDNPGHPDNNCVENHGCPGCHQELPKVMCRIKNLKSLTVGDADWHRELEALAKLMGVQEELHVTQLDCIELPPESIVELENQGWSFTISWRDPNPESEDFRRVASKNLRPPSGGNMADDRDW
ncbi:MAG: hypothetical protein M1837_001404 [Sclerophora amabilis]|nr:MAG: hypothetical protein M1837_001404 [Sclerophora amabilis]